MARAKGRGRGRGARGGRGRGRGRTKKMIIDSDDDQMDTSDTGETPLDTAEDEESSALDDTAEESTTEQTKDSSVEFNIDDDISQLVPPTFSTIPKGPPQPMLELSWEHTYTPIGEKIGSPNIHMCISCRLPIRLYGRLIPCKHVFCHTCAVKQGDRCSCCDERVSRIEKAPLGSVFMCLQGGIQFGYEGCRRTYLSQRDLQAHVNHRHNKPMRSGASSGGGSGSDLSSDKLLNSSSSTTPTSSSNSSHRDRQSIPVHYSSSRSNLISVPLQGLGLTSGSSGGGSRSSSSSSKDLPADSHRFDRKSSSSSGTGGSGPGGYQRNPSGWGSFRPY